jgi:hypothetical protein
MPADLSPKYERRLVLFIDFLGFKEVVAGTKGDPQALKRLIAALDTVGDIDVETIKSQQVTQFSDSIVVSYRVDEVSGVFWLLDTMANIIVNLAGRGFLLRGAVTVGELYHTSEHVVGPAMVAAYELESKIAKYPRVIIDPQVLRAARCHRSEEHSPEDEERYVRNFMQKDTDNYYYFDYISWDTVVRVVGVDDGSYGDYLAVISRVLGSGLRHTDLRVQEKYQWVYRHYIAALDTFASMPDDHLDRRQSPENFNKIRALPRHFNLIVKE